MNSGPQVMYRLLHLFMYLIQSTLLWASSIPLYHDVITSQITLKMGFKFDIRYLKQLYSTRDDMRRNHYNLHHHHLLMETFINHIKGVMKRLEIGSEVSLFLLSEWSGCILPPYSLNILVREKIRFCQLCLVASDMPMAGNCGLHHHHHHQVGLT